MNQPAPKGKKTIALNKRARFEYHIEERFEAGIALEGWEVKALRDGRIRVSPNFFNTEEEIDRFLELL